MGEGRRREVRRLCAAVGLEVVDLVRTAVGPISLGRLAEGESRPLAAAEMAALRRSVGLDDLT
jgi:23S rRNA pseudouridine2605 synthase